LLRGSGGEGDRTGSTRRVTDPWIKWVGPGCSNLDLDSWAVFGVPFCPIVHVLLCPNKECNSKCAPECHIVQILFVGTEGVLVKHGLATGAFL
jgi:hypothetical protein